MKPVRETVVGGWALIVLGLLALLGNLGVGFALSDAVWAALFALGAAGLLVVALRERARWWALIPSSGLLGVSLSILANGAAWTGPAMLVCLGAGFLGVLTRQPGQWWPVIPGGVLLSTALAAAFPGPPAAPLMFLGFAATFAVLALVPARQPQPWAWYPAGGALLLALLSGGWFTGALGTYWPVALILLGAALMWPRIRHH